MLGSRPILGLGIAAALSACGSGQTRSSSPGGIGVVSSSTGTDTGTSAEALSVADVDAAGLKFTIFSYEASLDGAKAASHKDVAPAVKVNFAEAKAACEAAGFRLCTLSEWTAACKGPDNLKFGFADTAEGPPAVADTCDVGRTGAKPGDLPSKTGAHTSCKTKGLELYDMIGNAAEWVVSDSTPVAAGEAFYQAADQSHCDQTLALTEPTGTTMDPGTQSTDLGFRCCKEAAAGSTSSSDGTSSDTGSASETDTGTDTDTAT
jgi:hypothetical protein